MHPTIVEHMAQARIEQFHREAEVARLVKASRIRRSEARTHRKAGVSDIKTRAWRRALAAVALSAIRSRP